MTYFVSSMARVIVLGGCGTVGTIAVKTLAGMDDFSEIVIADIDYEKAQACVSEIGGACSDAVQVDATDPQSIKNAIRGSDVVLNVCGPFYKLGPMI